MVPRGSLGNPLDLSGERTKAMREELVFGAGDYVVYPTHGVGKVLGIETREIAGHELELFVISFDRDRMTLRVPIGKADRAGLRRLSTRRVMEAALTKLKGRARKEDHVEPARPRVRGENQLWRSSFDR